MDKVVIQATEDVSAISIAVSESDDFAAVDFGDVQLARVGYDPYEGPVEITPSEETQILHTENLALLSDIIINPIPSNYGLISWNGSVLTVS